MNIFFDYQTFFQQQYGGISRYFCELITGINDIEQHHAHLSLLWSNNVHLKEYKLPIPGYPFPNKIRLFDKSNRLYNYLDAKISKYDIYHATYFDNFLVPYIGSTPFLTTFHDMTYERLSHQFTELSAGKQIVLQKKKIAQQACHLIAVSESTKLDMIEILGINPNKITVIYLASPFKQIEHNLSRIGPVDTRPYLLYVGNRFGYKNFIPFLQAISGLLKRYKVNLICAGGNNFTHVEKNMIHSLSLDDFVKYKAISGNILQDLYKEAIAFVFPSLYEGFGIPILEAFACNCPCVVSDTSSLPEIAGDAALYMNPTDIDSMSTSIERIVLDIGLREKLIKNGQQQLLNFSWQRTVNETVNLYKKLM